MPVVQPVQAVPAVKPVARRAPTWFGAPTCKAPPAVTFDDVLAAALGRSPLSPASVASEARTEAPTPPFISDRVERRMSAPGSEQEQPRQRRPFAAVAAAYRAQSAPPCLRLLGLQLPCTEDDVRQAYRQQARALHPDAGGDPRAFVGLRAAYEEALRLASPAAA